MEFMISKTVRYVLRKKPYYTRYFYNFEFKGIFTQTIASLDHLFFYTRKRFRKSEYPVFTRNLAAVFSGLKLPRRIKLPPSVIPPLYYGFAPSFRRYNRGYTLGIFQMFTSHVFTRGFRFFRKLDDFSGIFKFG